MSDVKSPRAVLLFTEFGGALGSVCLALSVGQLKIGNFWPFILANIIRAGFCALQASAFGKTTKIVDDEVGAKGQFAVMVNKATFGTIFFGMFVSLYFVSKGSLQLAILFDFVTFVVNGFVVACFIPSARTVPDTTSAKPDYSNLPFYKKSFPELFTSDFILALVMFGANTLNARLYFLHPAMIPLASGAFGLSVWLAVPFDRYFRFNKLVLWAWLAAALVSQGFLSDSPQLLLISSLLRNLAYWIIYNRITIELTESAPQKNFGKLSASRQATAILVGSSGEWWVGATSAIPAFVEMSWRGLVAGVYGLKINFNRRLAIALLLIVTLAGAGAKADMTTFITLPLLAGGHLELDPQKMQNVSSVFVVLQIHRGLMRFTPDLQVVGALAESYEVLDSGKRFRFHLRKTSFSDGTRIKSDDVVATFRRLFTDKGGMSADLDYIEGAKLLMQGKRVSAQEFGVTAISDSSVEFRMTQVNPIFLTHMAAVDSAIFKISAGAVVGAGPFELSSTSEKAITLTRNSGYFQRADKSITEIRFLFVKNESEAIQLAKDAKIDSLDNFAVSSPDSLELLRAGWHREVTQLARSIFLSLGSKLSSGVRLSIQALVNQEYQPPKSFAYRKAYGVIPDVLPGALSKSDVDVIVTAAPTLPKKLRLFCLQNSEELAHTAGSLRKILESHGASVELKMISADDYFAALKSGDYDLILRSKYLDYPDALSILTYFDSRIAGNTFNVHSSKLDEMLEQAKTLNNGPTKYALYRAIQIEALKLATVVPVAFGSNASGLWSQKVKAVPEHPMGIHSLPIDSLEFK